MQELNLTQNVIRPRFRSVRYSITPSKTTSKYDNLKKQVSRTRNKSIINADKLNSVIKHRKGNNDQHFTVDATEEKDIYLKTFLSFASKDYYRQSIQNIENVDIYAFISDFDEEFDKKDSHFTFFDTMKKPTQYIQKVLKESVVELKGQKYDIVMLKAELKRIRVSTQRSMADMTSIVKAKVAEITNAFHGSEVSAQQKKLRHRKEVDILTKGYSLNRNMVNSLLQRNTMIQDKIFACRPLELQINNIIALQVSDEEE